ncbi:unnamed protein product, partial [Adineta ricciae]
DYFLYWYYAIFDINNNRVGFAKSASYNWTPTADSSLFLGTATATTAGTTTTATATKAVTTTTTITTSHSPMSAVPTTTEQKTATQGGNSVFRASDILWIFVVVAILRSYF